MVFFSKDQASADARLREISKVDKYYKGKKAVLAEKQIPHIDGWKTFEEM